MTSPPCPQSESAYDFISGRMTEAERSAFADHLAGCPHCRAEVEALRVMVGHLDVWSPPQVSPRFAPKILA
ncbi:MAG: zf-HC2 domain-containing protein, partial [Proteobacteria bacterium]|nr:zf-HC2 domain-containing protein [Pseudomonadota bacterium]